MAAIHQRQGESYITAKDTVFGTGYPLLNYNLCVIMLTLEKFSIGVGDRFAHQAKAQLQACRQAAARGVNVIHVWNKSNREHGIVGSEPASVRPSANEAVRLAGWTLPYHVDAYHINLTPVDRFVDASDFYTL